MGNEPKWRVERQPLWLISAIKQTISGLPGGYQEAAEWLGVTENALYNRLRTDGDQIFPLGWAMVLQKASGSTLIADAVSRVSGCVNIPLIDVDGLDNADINVRMLESIEWIGRHSECVRKAIVDGVIDARERAELDETSYQVMRKWQEHISLLYRIYCEDATSPPQSL